MRRAFGPRWIWMAFSQAVGLGWYDRRPWRRQDTLDPLPAPRCLQLVCARVRILGFSGEGRSADSCPPGLTYAQWRTRIALRSPRFPQSEKAKVRTPPARIAASPRTWV